jgi:hypothetical protein
MPEIAVMPHMNPAFILPAYTGLSIHFDSTMISVLKNLPFDFLSHIHRSLVLRATSVSSLLLTIPSGHDPTTSILSKIDALDQEFLAWNSSLPHGVWGEKDDLYQMLATSLFRMHRIFLADLSISLLSAPN